MKNLPQQLRPQDRRPNPCCAHGEIHPWGCEQCFMSREEIAAQRRYRQPSLGKKKILFVDDEDVFVQRWLKGAGYGVVVAKNGWDALITYDNSGPYDAVITDVDHPGLKGVELADQIKKRNPLQPIAIYTTFDVKKYPVIQKVIDKETLLRLVAKLVDTGRS